ncbi:protein transport protein Sec24C [Scleropages formosus]|uniref:protein transport protein Sec24C n=1 Tax=Scleropages formosus TaxID=113540 RepID=UPI0010FABA0E|nr:protein transport protein Sec24C-like [Scleropages formosus]
MDVPAANYRDPSRCPQQRPQITPACAAVEAPSSVFMTDGSAPPLLLGGPCVQQQPGWGSSPHGFSGMFYVPNNWPLFCNDTQPPEGNSPQQEGGPVSPSSESRYGLEPQLLPSAVQVMEQDKLEWEGRVFVSEPSFALPPLATTDCAVEDRGNASPRFVRCTSYSFPCEGLAAQQSHVPLGAIVTPLARLEEGEHPLPVCTRALGKGHIPGCGECGAYMCPFMAWQDCGQRFHCPFCGQLTEVPWQCYQPTDSQRQRADSGQNPELSLGSYEILDNPAGEPAGLLLAVDVSAAAVRGQLDLICEQLRSLLLGLSKNEGEGTMDQSDLRVGLMTYDKRLHLYDLSPALSRPHMLVMTDHMELELPVCEGLLVPLKDCRDHLDSVLQQIPQLDGGLGDGSGSPDLPVRAGLHILKTLGCPGKVLVFHSTPLIEDAVNQRSSGFFSSSQPKFLFQAPDSGISLAKDCVSQGCCIHLFLFSMQDVGGAWPGYTPYLTGGGVFTYSSLQSKVNLEQLSRDLKRCVDKGTGYKADLRVFVSKGLRVTRCYGGFIPGHDPAHISMATIDWHTTLAIEFTHCSSLDEQRGVIIQAALSYTNARGERRVRVHSLALHCSHHLMNTFRNCQAQTLLTFYCKKWYCNVLERPLQELREELQTEVTEALACYRKHCCSSAVTPGQLVLPQYLKALPVYANSLRKSEVLLPGLRSTVPHRLQMRSRLVTMDTRSTALHFYPLLLRLPERGQPQTKLCELKAVRCSAGSLDPTDLYLAYGPLALLLWVGRHVPNTVLKQLFNVTYFSLLPPGETCLPVLDNPLSICIRKLIESLQSQAPYSLKLTVAKQGDVSEEALHPLLVEDKSPNGGASYADFIYHLHINSLRLMV